MKLNEMQVSPETQEKLEQYLHLMLEANKVMNLTAVTDWDEALVRHLTDSLMGASLLPEGAKVADVGTGAGLPGLPLAIARPDCSFVLADTLKKRVDFLSETVKTLGLTNVATLWIRAEDMGRDPKYREQFDVAVCRALAALRLSLEYLHPMVKVGGFSLFWKGSSVAEEIEAADKALRELKGAEPILHPYTLPGQQAQFALLQVKKTQPTPKKYPRRVGVPAKNPL